MDSYHVGCQLIWRSGSHSLFSSFGTSFTCLLTFYPWWLLLFFLLLHIVLLRLCTLTKLHNQFVEFSWFYLILKSNEYLNLKIDFLMFYLTLIFIITNPTKHVYFFHPHFMETPFSFLSNIVWSNALFTWTIYILNWNWWVPAVQHQFSNYVSTVSSIESLSFLSFQKCQNPCFLKVMLHLTAFVSTHVKFLMSCGTVLLLQVRLLQSSSKMNVLAKVGNLLQKCWFWSFPPVESPCMSLLCQWRNCGELLGVHERNQASHW